MDKTGEARYEVCHQSRSDLTPDTTVCSILCCPSLTQRAQPPVACKPATAALLQYATAAQETPAHVQAQLLSFCMENAPCLIDSYAP
jgi:hypothetical protein